MISKRHHNGFLVPRNEPPEFQRGNISVNYKCPRQSYLVWLPSFLATEASPAEPQGENCGSCESPSSLASSPAAWTDGFLISLDNFPGVILSHCFTTWLFLLHVSLSLTCQAFYASQYFWSFLYDSTRINTDFYWHEWAKRLNCICILILFNLSKYFYFFKIFLSLQSY